MKKLPKFFFVTLAIVNLVPTEGSCIRRNANDATSRDLKNSGGDIGNGPKDCPHALAGASPDFDEGTISACQELDIGAKNFNTQGELGD